jgi:ATP-dependent DNA helicase RecQ
VSAFTATASPQVGEAIARYLFGDDRYSLITADMDKPNIRYSVVPSVSPRHSLIKLLDALPRPLIVFDQSRSGVRLLCEFLRNRGIQEVKFYHAGLSREEKEAVEDWFMKSETGILVSTCAYGMGVDKKNIRSVLHYSAPPSVEAYIQESGRAGRDGDIARAVLIKDLWKEELRPERRPEDSRTVLEPGRDLGGADSGAQRDLGGTGSGARLDASSQADAAREARKKAFMEYGSSMVCRRASLLSLMGGELSSPCSGCDVCDGSAAAEADGLAELRGFFSANRFRFGKGKCLRLLCEAAPGQAGATKGAEKGCNLEEPPACPGAGLLAAWDREEVDALLTGALAKGMLRQGSWLYGRKRLGLAHSERRFRP